MRLGPVNVVYIRVYGITSGEFSQARASTVENVQQSAVNGIARVLRKQFETPTSERRTFPLTFNDSI